MRFMRLISNELLKLHVRRKNYIFIGFLLAITVAAGLIMKQTMHGLTAYGFAAKLQPVLNYPILLFMIIYGAQTIAEEFKEGTIKQLLIRPPSRSVILLSKYATGVTVMTGILLFSCLASIITGLVLFENSDDYTLLTVFKSFLYAVPSDLFYFTLALLIGTAVASVPLALSLSIILHLVGGGISAMIAKYEWSKFIVLNHLNLRHFDSDPHIGGTGASPYPDINLFGSLLINAVYLAAFLVLACYVFYRKEVK
ncbi:ABC transporter permease [Paenibacillus radicis (ex Gao et al. 2016)]|uniref:ABC transporter permease n=1 Tax=Paenibacillus radicis (ex Gao et al. 2016) TaxID=1737354 RepID=A0A917HJG3_9BACL|nr:ABC transporter permease [Paenibacillus radicis (ex Gao et al. 2016)]GGG80930.1 ABC transporter permease [Paenibacillus radicis (ex Gao et al. 2016)]